MRGNVFAVSVAVALFAFCGAIAFGMTEQNAADSGESETSSATDFYVESVSPQGELSSSVRFPSVQVVFSEPVVPLSRLGEPTSKSDVVTIVPAVKGVFRWYGTSILSFDADDALIPQKKYTISVNPNLTSLKGKPLGGKREFSFQTEPLRLLSAEPGYTARTEKKIFVNSDDVLPEYARDIAVSFSNKVNPAFVEKYLVIQAAVGGEKNPVEYDFSCKAIGEKTLLLSVQKAFPRDCTVSVILAAGAMPDADCVPTREEQIRLFHTLRPFAFRTAGGSAELHIRFNHRIQEKTERQIFDALSFSPAMELSPEKLEIHGNTVFVHDIPVTYGDNYSFTLKGGVVRDIYGQICGEDICENISVPDADSFASFKHGGTVVLESQFAPQYAFAYQNILAPSSYTVTPVCGVSDSFLLPEPKTTELKANKVEKNRRVVKAVPLKDFLETAGGEKRGAVRFESTVSYEGFGRHKNDLVEAKNDTLIQVTNLGVTVHSAWNETVVMVTSLRTGFPVRDADVRILYAAQAKDGKRNQTEFLSAALTGNAEVLAAGKTDAEGLSILHFDFTAEDYYASNLFVEIRTKNRDDRIVQVLPSHWSATPYRAYNLGAGQSNQENPLLSVSSPAVPKKMVTYICSDRGLYRPGETVRVKILDRNLSLGEYEVYNGGYEVSFTESTWKSPKTYALTEGTVSAQGTASATWEIPADIKPGTYYITYKRKGEGDERGTQNAGVTEAITVQFFERVRFQASAEILPMAYIRNDSLSATVSSSYLGGGMLVGGTVHGDWTRESVNFVPAGERFSGMTCGPLLHQFYWHKDTAYDRFHAEDEKSIGEDGKALLVTETGSEPIEGATYRYRLEAQVTDSGNQMIASRADALVHPASFYIGLGEVKGARGFARKGEPCTFLYTIGTPGGLFPQAEEFPSDKKITWQLSRKSWHEVPFTDDYGYTQYRWEEETVVEKMGLLPFPRHEEAVSYSLIPDEGGQYLLSLESTDRAGRKILTERSFYVTGSDSYRRDSGDADSITLSADKERYEAGETAHILLESTLPSGAYLMTVEREGVISEKVLHLSEPTTVLDVPVTDAFVPAVWVSVSSVTGRTGETAKDYDSHDSHKPKSVQGSVMLQVSNKSRSFDIAVSTDKKNYRPAEKATITFTATKEGKPLSGAELTVLVVDRGVLDVIGYQAKNPLDFFYERSLFDSRTSRSDSRQNLIDPVTYGTYTTSAQERQRLYYANRLLTKAASAGIASPVAADMLMTEACAESESSDGAPNALVVRKDFRATALFEPTLVTNEDGVATVTFTLPDSLTEYVVTVLGAKEQLFGYETSSLVCANPVSVRDVETRILRLEDEGEAGVVITNIGDKDQSVQVDFAVLSGLEKTGREAEKGSLIRQAGKARIIGNQTLQKNVRLGGTETLMFHLIAEEAGWVTLSFTVRAGDFNEVVYKPLEIEKPFVYETVTTVGELNRDESLAEESIVFPPDADENRAHLFVHLDPSRLGTLSTAVDYVFRYPYGCLEQRSSAILPLIAFGDYLSVFGLQSEVTNPLEVVSKEMTAWSAVQRPDGGFPYWKDGRESSFSVSLRLAETLALAKEKGISVPSSLNEEKLASYIQKEMARLKKEGPWYPCAYAYYVLSRMGKEVSAAELETLVSKNSGVSECAFAGLSAYLQGYDDLAEKAASKLKNMISLTARGASFQTAVPWGRWSFYNGNAERYALSLHLFTLLNSQDRYNGHLVWELLQMQKAGNGHWQSTAMTSRVLIALDAYIRANGLGDTDFTAESLLNGTAILYGECKGMASKSLQTTITAEKNPKGEQLPLVIKKDGTGNLFYTASLVYALPAAQQKARDEGICVYTEITDARTGKRVTEDALQSGRIYRQKVHVSASKERAFVAVRVPVPAGCEILNSAFATTAIIPGAGDGTEARRPWQNRYRLSHQDIYDAEIRCFWDYFPIGEQSFEFLFRAQRSGTYNAPSILAECMYEPEIFGRSDGKVWKIQ